MSSAGDTANRILDAAQELAQTRGYNAFSYADVSQQVGIRTASIHYYYPSKSDLGLALVDRYTTAVQQTLTAIERANLPPIEMLRRYTELFLQTMLQGGRMCLAGILAADVLTLSSELREAVQAFFTMNEQWLATVLQQGRDAGAIQFDGSPEAEAKLLVASLEGALLVARSYGDVDRYRELAEKLVTDREVSMEPR